MSTRFWLFIVYIVVSNIAYAPEVYQQKGEKHLVTYFEGQIHGLVIASIIFLLPING